MRIVLIGANGFVGSAFARLLRGEGRELVEVTRANYAQQAGAKADVVIDAAGNSRKFFAEERPLEEFDTSVGHRLRTLRDFPAPLHLHISSVDVYPDISSPRSTREDAAFDPVTSSKYGLHKKIAEDLVRAHAADWLIVRLGGMVGPNMRKSPVFDLLNRQPQRIHPDSRFQYINTDDAARLSWKLLQAGIRREVFNLCGTGTVSPREISHLAKVPLVLDQLPANAKPRIVEASNEKLGDIMKAPVSLEVIKDFLKNR